MPFADSLRRYRVGATIVDRHDADDIRSQLRPLLLRGQTKFHWGDEKPERRIQFLRVIAPLAATTIVVTHVDKISVKEERSRRKCLEHLYPLLTEALVSDLTLESRTPTQNKNDVAHIVAWQGMGRNLGIRLDHCPGKDDPLLWIPDAILGAVNAHALGDASYLTELDARNIKHVITRESLI